MTVRFDEYYNPAKIDGYIFKIYGSPEGVLTALELKEIDMISYDLVPAHIELIEANEGNKYGHLELTTVPDIGFFYLGFNIDKAPINNKAFRIAVAHLVIIILRWMFILTVTALEAVAVWQ